MKQSDIKLNISKILTSLHLGFSSYAHKASVLIADLLLIDIGSSFGIPVGLAVQLNSVRSLFSFFFALLVGILSIKFRLGFLLLTGVSIALFSTVGCSISSSFQMLLVFYAINGIAYSLVVPMKNALVGELFPKEKHADIFSKTFLVVPIITVLSSPFIGYIGDWRRAFLLFAIPISTASFILTKACIPVIKKRGKEIHILSAFKSIIVNISALSLIIGSSLT